MNNPTETMNIDNKVSAIMTDEAVTNCLNAVQTLHTNMPFLINLTKAMKRQFPTIGTERAGMLPVYLTAMNNHPTLVPGFVDMTEVTKDAELWEKMRIPLTQLSELCEAIIDTHHAVGSDLFMAFLSFYKIAKEAARRNVTGADTLVATLRPWFDRTAGELPPPEPEA